MSKLIIKQELPPPSAQERLVDILQVILPIILLIIAIAAAVSLYVAPDTDSLGQGQASLPAAARTNSLPNAYLAQERELNALALAFDDAVETQAESHAKNAVLVQKAEALLSHVNAMDALVGTLTLDAQDKQVLLTRHQYQKDYWESKLVFHRLRMARFTADTPAPVAVEAKETPPAPPVVETQVTEPSPAPASVPEAVTPPAAAQQPASPDKAALPPGVQLPPGMCPLFGPGAAECKAGKH
ncbi:hypothetical protein [Thiothrix unzii]|uniref:Uncharacterized protein n=1 Tax=Thiothrix unzii TaxID=111769 RepID=A0A975F7H0_9GAMM|nr:hypothetical protein [Thiothrix unzii]QTR52468.1 hypothetical protein J9260_12100 [Thiothrix unzii]